MLKLLAGFLIDLIKNISGRILRFIKSRFVVICIIIENIFGGTALNSL